MPFITEKLWQFLPQAGLDIEQIKKDMNDPAIAEIIAQDLADAKTLNVTKTPGYFVNGKPLQTFGYRQLQQLIQSEIAATYPGVIATPASCVRRHRWRFRLR